MEILTGNLYFVSDIFFEKIQDPYSAYKLAERLM